jgi:hypothetical protein
MQWWAKVTALIALLVSCVLGLGELTQLSAQLDLFARKSDFSLQISVARKDFTV